MPDNERGNEKEFITHLKNSKKIFHMYDNIKWHGCQELMSIITHDFLKKLVDEYDLFGLIKYVDNESDNRTIDRVFAIMCYSNSLNLIMNPSIFGDIRERSNANYSFEKYLEDKRDDCLDSIIKIE